MNRIFPEEESHDERDKNIDTEAVRNHKNGKYDPDKRECGKDRGPSDLTGDLCRVHVRNKVPSLLPEINPLNKGDHADNKNVELEDDCSEMVEREVARYVCREGNEADKREAGDV